MKRFLLMLAVLLVWAALLYAGILWDGREVAVPTISSPDVETRTVTPEPDRPVPFPRSTLPPTWKPWTDTIGP